MIINFAVSSELVTIVPGRKRGSGWNFPKSLASHQLPRQEFVRKAIPLHHKTRPMNTCSPNAFYFDTSKIREFKQDVVIQKEIKWADVRETLEEVVGYWACEYDRLVQIGFEEGFCFIESSDRKAHCEATSELLDVGCDLLLIIHLVEDGSEPPVVLKEMERSLTNALRALKIAKSAYSRSTEGLHSSALSAVLAP